MAYELGAWGQMVDRAVDDPTSTATIAKSAVWGLKAFMAGQIGPGGAGAWSVVRSSDGVTDAYSDLWGTAYDGSKLVRAAAGVAHSWVVLQAPVTMGSLFVCFDLTGPSDNSPLANASKFSKLGFTTGGTILNRPTASDETTGSSWTNLTDIVTFQHKLNGILSPRGDFLFFMESLGHGITFNFMCMKAQEAKPSDEWPWIFGGYCNTYASFNNFFLNTNYYFCRVGAGALAPGQFGPLVPHVSTGSYPFLLNLPPNGDYQSHLWPAFPSYFGIGDVTLGGVKGRLPDIRLGPVFVNAAGAQSPSLPAAAEYTLIGGLWLPFTVSPSL